MFPRILTRFVDWVRAEKQFGVEVEGQGSSTRVVVRMWTKNSFIRVAVAVIDRYHGDPGSELSIRSKIIFAVRSKASLVAIHRV